MTSYGATNSINDGPDDHQDLGDLPHENTPLLHTASFEEQTNTPVKNIEITPSTRRYMYRDPNQPKRERNYSQYSTASSRTRVGSLIGSVTHTISTSVRKLQKTVGFLQGFTLIVGILIGSGVFISPSLVMQSTHDAGISFVLWFACGLIALGGSLCYVELGCAIKRAGGNYAYIQEAYGDLPAFLCCWTVAFIVDPAGVAAITLTLGTYVIKPFEEWIEPNPWYPKCIAAGVILMIALVNCWSVRAATRAQTLFTFAQILSVVFVVCIGIWQLAKEGTGHITHGMFNVTSFTFKDVGPLGAALYNGLWAYDGWALVSNVTEEMTNLERNLFLSIITGIPFVICCYLLVNLSFLAALSVEQIANSPAVAVTFIDKTLGHKAAFAMPILVALSCYGAANGTVFACGRLSLAAGREGHLPELLSMIHKKRHTPIPAVIMTSIISLVMLIPDASGLETLISFFNFSCWFIYGLSLFAVVVLRIRQPDLHRPYKVWIITPILMTLISLFLVIVPFLQNPINPLIASGMIAMGVPFYFLFVYLEPKHPTALIAARRRFKKRTQKLFNLAPCTM